MKNIIIALVAAASFIPVAVIGWVNRPAHHPTPFAPVAVVWPASEEVQRTTVNVIELKPVKIWGNLPQAKKTESEKVYVCRDRELLSGGTVQNCDWL